MAASAPKHRRPAPATIALALAALIAAGALSYSLFFRSGGAGASGNEAAAANGAAASAGTEELAGIEGQIAGLVEALRRNPDDHARWYQLALAYRDLGSLTEAVAAFRRAMELQPRNPEYTAFLAEILLIEASRASQPPPPEAEQLLRRTLELQPGNPRARFYLATIRDLRGDHRGAIDDLIALLRAPELRPDQAPQVRQAAIFIAQRHNIDLGGRLPPEPAAAPPSSVATAGIPGPTPEQMRAASAMTPSQQNAMGREMVERLAARLRANPRDENRWIMLMRSRMVLQDPNGAAEALRSALGAFANDAATQGRLRQAARELRVPGG